MSIYNPPVGGGGGGGSAGGGLVLASFVNHSGVVLTAGMMVYFDGAGTVDLARSDSDFAHAFVQGIVYDASIGIGATGQIALAGLVPALSGGVAGQSGFLTPTPGNGFSATADEIDQHFNVRCGVWSSTTAFNFRPTVPFQS